MKIWNQTGYPHEFTTATDVAGHVWIVVVVKGTFDFPGAPGGKTEKAETQVPLVFADTHVGQPGYSSTLWETDFAFRKPHCDIVLNGCAYAPNGRPAERVQVGLKVGNWIKRFDVVGDREWRAIGPVFTSTSAKPFLKMPINYDRAWGGTDRLDPKEESPGAYPHNPVGTGWARVRNQNLIPGLRLPNTQASDEEVRTPFGDYKPMSFGPMGRGWPGRIEHGGTYDDNWSANIFPFLPPDFDDRYFQMAPPDQQTSLPRGGEDVALVNLTPSGRETFRLPDTRLPLVLFRNRVQAFEGEVLPDTILFDPEQRRFSLVWRVSQRINRSLLEFNECWIGPPTRGMLRSRATGKPYVKFSDWRGPVGEDEANAA